MTINNQIYATVKDTIQGLNINPPKCNCRLAADRDAENERIRGDADRNKNGVCRYLMQLNEEGDNYRVEGTEYLKRDNAIMVFENGEDGQAVQVGTCIEHTNIERSTMTSVLFCKHGGLIMPVTSGQENYVEDNEIMDISTDTMDSGKISKKALMELEILNEYSDKKGYLVIENGKLIGKKPHLAGDNYVTVGFGDCLQEGDMSFYMDPERGNRIFGYLSDKVNEYNLMKDTVIPVDICFEKLIQDVTPLYEKAKSDFEGEGLILSQNELDALCIIKYQCNTIGDRAYNEILNGCDRKKLYDAVLEKHGKNGNFESRTKVEMNIFFGDNNDDCYSVEGGLNGIIVEPLEDYYEE